jgi:hypothetical protein
MDPKPNQGPPKIIQLKIYQEGISPMIWRRVLVREDISLAELHGVFQTIMGWENIHLNKFIIYGRHLDAFYRTEMYLKDFCFRKGDKFLYEYNFYVPWNHQVRVEKIVSIEKDQGHPLCIAGKNACPPEEIQGISEFIEFSNIYRNDILYLLKILEIQKGLGYPYRPDVFNKSLINQRLKNKAYINLPKNDPLFPDRSDPYFSDAYWKKKDLFESVKMMYKCIKKRGLEAENGYEVLSLFLEETVCIK